MVGGAVSEVVATRLDKFQRGEIVVGNTGWQEWALSDGAGLTKVERGLAPPSTALGVLGMPGMTAYTGLLNIGQPKPSETLSCSFSTMPVGTAPPASRSQMAFASFIIGFDRTHAATHIGVERQPDCAEQQPGLDPAPRPATR
jgi:NADPH-dependent curcumin reductase CurA